MPSRAVGILSWTIRLLILILAAQFSVMLAAILGALLAVAFIASRADFAESDEQPKLRDGLLGFGLYDRHDMRVDPHDTEDGL